MAELDLRAVQGTDGGVVVHHDVQDGGHGDGLAGLILSRLTEAVEDDALEVQRGLIGGVGTLQGPCLLFRHPVPFARLHLCQQLPAPSSIKMALKSLQDKEFLFYDSKQGYMVYDRFFGMWLKRLAGR